MIKKFFYTLPFLDYADVTMNQPSSWKRLMEIDVSAASVYAEPVLLI